MPNEQFQQILQYIEQYKDDDYIFIESGTAASEAQIAEIETQLGITLSQDFREYLATFGTLSIPPDEFAGFIGADDRHDLDVVKLRNELAEHFEFPLDLIPLLNEDGDSYVCLTSNGELIRWFPFGGKPFHIDESLGEFLLRLCEELIEDEAGEPFDVEDD